MDRDDQHRSGGNNDDDQHFEDDARYNEQGAGAVEEEYAAGQEEWDQPLDEQAGEEDPHEPVVKKDPFAEDNNLEDGMLEDGPLEDDYVHQAADGQDFEDDAEQPQAAPAKKSPMMPGASGGSPLAKYLPLIGGGLAVAVLGFFGFQQFMGTPETPSEPKLENQNTWDNESQATGVVHNSQEVAQQQPLPTPIEQPPAQPAAQMPVTNTGTNVITPVEPIAQPSTTATANAQLESRISELTQQLEQMKQTQDQLNQKLQTATATPPSMDEASKAATRAFEERIAQLEQKLNAANSNSANSNTAAAISAMDTPSKLTKRAARLKAAAQAMADEPNQERKSTRASKASTDFMVAKKNRTVRKQRAREKSQEDGDFASAPSRAVQSWILRSAQPGSAWLSQGPYSNDLRRVVPGDKVQGLGTITSVRQVAGRWVVEGTQGAVR